MAKVHKTPKEKCINCESGCAKIFNNVVQLLAREEQSWQEYTAIHRSIAELYLRRFTVNRFAIEMP